MCGRYFIDEGITSEELQIIIDAVNRNLGKGVKTKGEIFPSDTVPVLTKLGPQAMKWGFSRFDGKGLVINARSEGIESKAMFKTPIQSARCLIPASYYFEWQQAGNSKVKHRISAKDLPLFFMAGIYRQEPNQALPVFTILTRDASPDIRSIHDRMPVILPKESRSPWLAASTPLDSLLATSLTQMAALPDEPIQMRLF